jgi:hypothetical protein
MHASDPLTSVFQFLRYLERCSNVCTLLAKMVASSLLKLSWDQRVVLTAVDCLKLYVLERGKRPGVFLC